MENGRRYVESKCVTLATCLGWHFKYGKSSWQNYSDLSAWTNKITSAKSKWLPLDVGNYMHLWTLIHRPLVDLALVIPPRPKHFISQHSTEGWKFQEYGASAKGHIGTNRVCGCGKVLCIVFHLLNLSQVPCFLWSGQKDLFSLSLYVCSTPSTCAHFCVQKQSSQLFSLFLNFLWKQMAYVWPGSW